MTEEWRDVVGYEGRYQVSNLGNVRSVDRVIVDTGKGGTIRKRFLKGKVLKPQLNTNGYYTVPLPLREDGTKEILVSRMVAKAFIPNPNNLPCVNHKDENSKNNRVDNLEWCTKEYNNRYGTIRERHRQMMLGKKQRPRSEETKQKIRNTLMGHPVSKETREKISKACKGHIPWNKGLKLNNREERGEQIMNRYSIHGEYTISFDCEVFAENEMEAEEKAYDINIWEACNNSICVDPIDDDEPTLNADGCVDNVSVELLEEDVPTDDDDEDWDDDEEEEEDEDE